MRILIDGYNLMHAMGAMPAGRPLSPQQFHKVRARFLSRLADGLDPVDAHQTTVVFDARNPPPDRADTVVHRGIRVIFATAHASADERIEEILRQHSAPMGVTVVSSDHQVQRAARRRRAKPVSADDFLDQLALRRARAGRDASSREDEAREHGLSSEESDYWLKEFDGLEDDPEVRAALPDLDLLRRITDADIRQLEREVDEEMARRFGPRP